MKAMLPILAIDTPYADLAVSGDNLHLPLSVQRQGWAESSDWKIGIVYSREYYLTPEGMDAYQHGGTRPVDGCPLGLEQPILEPYAKARRFLGQCEFRRSPHYFQATDYSERPGPANNKPQQGVEVRNGRRFHNQIPGPILHEAEARLFPEFSESKPERSDIIKYLLERERKAARRLYWRHKAGFIDVAEVQGPFSSNHPQVERDHPGKHVIIWRHNKPPFTITESTYQRMYVDLLTGQQPTDAQFQNG